jgi:hypothetical protein
LVDCEPRAVIDIFFKNGLQAVNQALKEFPSLMIIVPHNKMQVLLSGRKRYSPMLKSQNS